MLVDDYFFKYNLTRDEILHEVNNPGFMTNRTRETLRRNSQGEIYLYEHSDGRPESITTFRPIVDAWILENIPGGLKVG